MPEPAPDPQLGRETRPAYLARRTGSYYRVCGSPFSRALGACLLAVAVAGPAAADQEATAEGTLAAADHGSGAVSYNPAVAPAGAHLSVTIDDADGSTVVALDVEGLLPDRGYAAHAHVKPCGATGADAGPHFQHAVDPAAGPDQPSTDPAYANPDNEVWLDLHTDADGAGHAETELPFAFAANRSPRSIVVHEAEATATHAGHAGTAGDRAACITLPSRRPGGSARSPEWQRAPAQSPARQGLLDLGLDALGDEVQRRPGRPSASPASST